jgi:hypothetical protein
MGGSMASLNEVFLRISPGSDRERLLETVREKLAGEKSPIELIVHPDVPWIRVHAEDDSGPRAELLAQAFPEVILLSVQTLVDFFQYVHWIDGRPVRRLEFGTGEEERTWGEASGEAEAWEEQALFVPGTRKICEENAEPQDREALRRAYDDRVLVVGSRFPALEARDAAFAIAAHFGLPGFQGQVELDGREWRQRLSPPGPRPLLGRPYALVAVALWAVGILYVVLTDAPKVWGALLMLGLIAVIVASAIERPRSANR